MQTWREATVSERVQYELISLIFSKHPKLLEFFFEKHRPRMSYSPVEMLKEIGVFSTGEELLIRVAMDIWSGSGNTKLWRLIEQLDHDNFSNVLKALDNWKHFRSVN